MFVEILTPQGILSLVPGTQVYRFLPGTTVRKNVRLWITDPTGMNVQKITNNSPYHLYSENLRGYLLYNGDDFIAVPASGKLVPSAFVLDCFGTITISSPGRQDLVVQGTIQNVNGSECELPAIEENGECICPAPAVLEDGKCICPESAVINSVTGRCECPADSYLDGNVCRKCKKCSDNQGRCASILCPTGICEDTEEGFRCETGVDICGGCGVNQACKLVDDEYRCVDLTEGEGVNIGLIVGIVIGIIFFFILVGLLFYLLTRPKTPTPPIPSKTPVSTEIPTVSESTSNTTFVPTSPTYPTSANITNYVPTSPTYPTSANITNYIPTSPTYSNPTTSFTNF